VWLLNLLRSITTEGASNYNHQQRQRINADQATAELTVLITAVNKIDRSIETPAITYRAWRKKSCKVLQKKIKPVKTGFK